MTKKLKVLATIQDEIALENEYKATAERVLKASYEKAVLDGRAGTTKVGERLIDNAWKQVRANIINGLYERDYSGRGVAPAFYPLVNQIKQLFGVTDEAKDELYNLTTLVVMNALVGASLQGEFSNKGNSRSALANSIASEMEREIKASVFLRRLNKHDAKGVEQSLNKRSREDYKEKFMSSQYRQFEEEMADWVSFDKSMTVRLADALIDLACKGSGYFELVEDEREGKAFHGRIIVRPKEWLLKTWLKNVDIMTDNAYKYCPMVVKPRPWQDMWNGGYYDVLTKRIHLLRVDWDMPNSFMTNYKERLNKMDMSYLYRVVNALQDTPFTINDDVLKVAQTIYRNGGGMAGIDQVEPIPKPRINDDATEEEKKRHRYMLSLLYKADRAKESRLLRVGITLGTAQKFSKWEKIYFPWNMDYRGRLYPISTELSPQGDDLQKALLLFAEPSPVKEESALRWFLIEGANRAGVDKVPFDDRVAWVKEHHDAILASAADPMTNTFWAEQDEPFLFLAWSYEYKKLQEYLTDHNGSVIGFTTGIPLNYDGTCSGLQHFSMILRDEIGGKAVNLVPQETVSDIYGIVANKINPILKQDAVSGTDDAPKVDKETGEIVRDTKGNILIQYGTKTLAQWWLEFARQKYHSDGITRKVCKRSVMTLAYGSGRYGFSENLKEDIIKPFKYDHPDTNLFVSKSQAANYLAALIWDAVSTTVVKAVEGMNWLQKIAKLITKNGKVVQWVTPNGLLVQQNKYKERFTRVYMYFNGAKHNLYVKETPVDIDRKGQVQAISPNFIHSMDASHMQRVITALHMAGDKNLFMIHDSFGTDLAHADMLFKTIRYEFRHMYEGQDYLAKFLSDVSYLIPLTTKIPQQPKMGKLSIADTEKSKYCFA